MQNANDWQRQLTEIDADVLSSMISELVRHHEGQLTGNEHSLDWESQSRKTRVVKYGTSGSLFNILNQVPDAVAAEYQLSYQDTLVFSWHEYRWPHLQDTRQMQSGELVQLPHDCIEELMSYHIHAGTGWLIRYRKGLRCNRIAQIDEVGVMAQCDDIRAL